MTVSYNLKFHGGLDNPVHRDVIEKIGEAVKSILNEHPSLTVRYYSQSFHKEHVTHFTDFPDKDHEVREGYVNQSFSIYGTFHGE